MKLTILGNPTALKRHRTFRRGKFTGSYDPSKTDKADLLAIVRDNAPDKPFTCPLRVDITFYFARPKSHYRTGRYEGQLKPHIPLWHTKRPDRDNLDKFVLDALDGVFWLDDSIVCDGRLRKLYDDRPRTEIDIEILQESKS